MWEHVLAWLNADTKLKYARKSPIPTQQVDVSGDLSSGDANYSTNPLRRIYVGGAGSVFVKYHEDTAYFERVCPLGGTITGLIIGVQKSTTTATKLVGER